MATIEKEKSTPGLETLQAERDALALVVKAAWRIVCDGGDIEGYDFQQFMQKAGLAIMDEATIMDCEECDYLDPGDPIYRLTDLGCGALARKGDA